VRAADTQLNLGLPWCSIKICSLIFYRARTSTMRVQVQGRAVVKRKLNAPYSSSCTAWLSEAVVRMLDHRDALSRPMTHACQIVTSSRNRRSPDMTCVLPSCVKCWCVVNRWWTQRQSTRMSALLTAVGWRRCPSATASCHLPAYGEHFQLFQRW
jgi:hypothetical protein